MFEKKGLYQQKIKKNLVSSRKHGQFYLFTFLQDNFEFLHLQGVIQDRSLWEQNLLL